MDLLISLIPALVMILLVILTKRVIISLGTGIILGSLLAFDFNISKSIIFIWNSFYMIITDTGWYLPILSFVVIIGVIASLITVAGGTRAFADWSVSKVKNHKAAQLVAWMLGIIICIDDYFNTLVIGELSKPITDKYKVSRAKLSYIIDSTSAPVVILLPLSTWGAYIIGTLSGIFEEIGYTTYTGSTAFVNFIPLQFYAIVAIIFVYIVIKFDINLGPMKHFEDSANKGNDISKSINLKDLKEDDISSKGTPLTLILPIVILILSVFTFMYLSAGSIRGMLEVDITVPLFKAGLVGLVVAVILAIKNHVHLKTIWKSSVIGVKSTISALIILILAWMIGSVIGELGTGELISKYISNSLLNINLLPFIVFIISGFIAFATGTSWGTFGILLPIGASVAITSSPEHMLPILAAVLGGAVLGDHCSPISDTTVLSSTGAKCTLHAHFTSQLPYALFAGICAAFGYLVYGFTQNLLLSYLTIIVIISVFTYVYKYTISKYKDL